MVNFFKGIFNVLKILTITLGSIFVILIVIMICGLVGLMLGGGENPRDMIKSDRMVAVISVADEIGRNIKAEEFQRQLTSQLKDKNIKGVVVRIDSPGGSVGESEEMYLTIKNATNAKGRNNKPVVCSLGNTAASGALYIAAACDRVVTLKGTITGSIGVVMMSPNFSNVMRKYDVEMNVIKSGQFKDAGSPFRTMTEDDKSVLTGLVTQAFDQFVSAISESRKIPREDVLRIADGRIILGEEAVALGLADTIGNVNTAAQVVLDMLKLDGEADLVYQRKSRFSAFFENFADSKAGSWFLGKTPGFELMYRMY